MTNIDHYTRRRADLMRQLWFECKLRHRLNARARIRMIADLDYRERGIPKQETYELLHYDKPF